MDGQLHTSFLSFSQKGTFNIVLMQPAGCNFWVVKFQRVIGHTRLDQFFIAVSSSLVWPNGLPRKKLPKSQTKLFLMPKGNKKQCWGNCGAKSTPLPFVSCFRMADFWHFRCTENKYINWNWRSSPPPICVYCILPIWPLETSSKGGGVQVWQRCVTSLNHKMAALP